MQEVLNRLVKREKFYAQNILDSLKTIFSFSGPAKKAAAFVIIFEMLGALLFALPVTPRGEAVDMSKFTMTFEDDFNGDTLNEQVWKGHGFDLNSPYVHTRRGSHWVREMLSVEDGCLKIRTAYSQQGIHGGPEGYYNCGIETAFMQKYGYFECRCILPKGEGIWAAFWMWCPDMGKIGNGGVDGAEMDIFESPFYMKRKNDCVYMNIHYDGYEDAHMHENEGKFYANNPYEEFNTYGMEWNEDEYIFYINGIEACRTSFGGTSQVEEFMILSVEMESDDGWTGIPSAAVRNSKVNGQLFPADFVIDYVRAYQYI